MSLRPDELFVTLSGTRDKSGELRRGSIQPRPQGFLRIQNGGACVKQETWTRLQNYSKNTGAFCRVKHDEICSRFRLKNCIRWPEN